MKKALVKNFIISGFVLLSLGALMVFATDAVLNTFIRVIGIIILVGAVFTVVLQILSKKEERSVWFVILSVISAVVGVVFLAIPGTIAAYSVYVFGVMLILLSVRDLFSVVRFPFGRIFSIVFASLGIILGTIIICQPAQIAEIITKFIGGALIYQAAVCFMNAILVHRSAVEIEPAAKTGKDSGTVKDAQFEDA